MAKWYGTIGYVNTVDAGDGVWEDDVVERKYYGDMTRIARRLQSADYKTNDDLFACTYDCFSGTCVIPSKCYGRT